MSARHARQRLGASRACAGRGPLAGKRGQRGFALVTAIFLLVVLGALALFLLSLSGTQHFTSMWAAQGARAHYAASSGLEWGAWNALNGGACNGVLNVDAGGPGNFTVTVSCASSSHRELATDYDVWVIESTAQYGSFGSPGFVRRSQRSTVVSSP